MEQTLDDVKSQGLNKNPNIKTFKIPNTGTKDIMGLSEVQALIQTVTEGQGFTLVDFKISEQWITVVLEIKPRTHVQGI